MKLLLVVLVAVLLGTFFASSSNVFATRGHTRAEIATHVPTGLDSPTGAGGTDEVTASFNRSVRQLAVVNDPRLGTRGISIEASSDVSRGTVSINLSSTLWNTDLPSSTAPVTVDAFLEDEFEICAGDSGLQIGDPARVLFLSTLNGRIDVGEGNRSGTHSVTFTSSLFATTYGGRPIPGAELRYSQFLGRIGDPEQVTVMERGGRVVDVIIGQTLRIDTRLHGGFGGSGVPAGFDRPVTNELEIRGESLLLLTEGFLDICINSLGGAPLRAEGDEGLQGPHDVFDPQENIIGIRDPAAGAGAGAETGAGAEAGADAASSPDSAVGPIDPGRKILRIPPGSIRGRSIFGPIALSFSRVGPLQSPLGQITVITKQGEVTLLVDADTRISAPPDNEVGLEVLTHDPPTRVAVMTDRSPLAEDGTLSGEPVLALKIAVIPQIASRQHRRVVVAEKTTGDRIKFVDAAVGVADLAAKSNTGFEKGEIVFVLVQKGNSGVQRSRIKAVFKADVVAKRLERWANKEAGAAGDAFKRARIDSLLEKHLDAQAKKLEKISARAPKDLKNVFGQTVQRMAKARNAAKARLRNRGIGQADTECVLSLLGRVPATKSELTRDQRRRVDAECTDAKAATAPKLKIALSTLNEVVAEGTNVTIAAKAEGGGKVVSLEFIINGEVQPLIEDVAGFTGLEFPVPVGITSLEIQVKATDDQGNFVWESVDVPVVEDPPPTVGGLQLFEGWNLLTGDSPLRGIVIEQFPVWNLMEGAKYSIAVQAEDNGEVVSVELSIDGKSYPATLKDGKWIAEISIPEGPTLSDKVSTSSPPHIFVGTAAIGGVPAPDGTVVTAWVPAAAAATTSIIQITVTDDLSKTGTGAQEFTVLSKLIQAGRGTVTGGIYSVLVHQRQGVSFAGRTITFKLGDVDAEQTGVWQLGGADELNLNR